MVRRNSSEPFTEWLLNVSCFAESQAELEMAFRNRFELPAHIARNLAGTVWRITGGDAPIPASADEYDESWFGTPGNSGGGRSRSSSDPLEKLSRDELKDKVMELKEEQEQ